MHPIQVIEQKIATKAMNDEAYKQQLLRNPKATFEQELGQSLPADIEIEVLETTKNKAYVVLYPDVDQIQSQELSEQQLEAVAGGAGAEAQTSLLCSAIIVVTATICPDL